MTDNKHGPLINEINETTNTMKTKHTPGPWYSKGSNVYSENRQVAVTGVSFDTLRYKESSEQNDNNAQAISALPQLINAGLRILETDALLHHKYQYEYSLLKEAIKKATS